MSPPLFSIVIPCYNYAHTVGRAIDSVLGQKEGVGFEILVVNDGSKDGSEEVISRYLRQYPDMVRSVFQENSGLAAARNTGVRETTGTYLVFLDADDEMVGGALAGINRNVEEKGDVDLLIGGHVSVNRNGEKKAHLPGSLPEGSEARFLGYLRKKISIANGAAIMNRRIFESISYPEDLRNVEDIPVFALVLALFSARVLNFPVAMIHKHADSLRHNTAIAESVGLKVVDRLFDHPLLPEDLRRHRDFYYTRRCLSLFRIFYTGGDFARAKEYYHRALRTLPFEAMKGNYFGKYLKMRIKGSL